jgi:hypothetical protein
MQQKRHPRRRQASVNQEFTPKRVDKETRVIRDPKQFAEFITRRDRELLDRLEAYDRGERS